MPAPVVAYPSLQPAVERSIVEATSSVYSDHIVKKCLLQIASELTAVESSTKLRMRGEQIVNGYTPSVRTLHKRLRTGYYAPFSGITIHNENVAELAQQAVNKSTKASPMERPLGDFEDLYYAILAAVKAMHDLIILRLNNSFNRPDSPLFSSSGHTLSSFRELLLGHWNALNQPSLILALDKAIRRPSIENHLSQILGTEAFGAMTRKDVDGACTFLYEKNVVKNSPRLGWVIHGSPAMINGQLNEKYRLVFQMEKKMHQKKKLAKRRYAKKMTGSTRNDDNGKLAKHGHERAAGEGHQQVHKQQEQNLVVQAQQTAEGGPVLADNRQLFARSCDRESHGTQREQQSGASQKTATPNRAPLSVSQNALDRGWSHSSIHGSFFNAEHSTTAVEHRAPTLQETIHPMTQYHSQHDPQAQFPPFRIQSETHSQYAREGVKCLNEDHAVPGDKGRGKNWQRRAEHQDSVTNPATTYMKAYGAYSGYEINAVSVIQSTSTALPLRTRISVRRQNSQIHSRLQGA